MNRNSANSIEQNLQVKYGESFTVTHIGDRLGRDTVTAYAHPSNDSSLVFTVQASSFGEIISDGYSYRFLCRKVENITENSFSTEGLSTACIAEFIGCPSNTDKSISVEDFVQQYKPNRVKIAIVVEKDDNLSGGALSTAITDVCHNLPDINMVFSIFCISPNDTDVLQGVRKEPFIFGEDRLEQLGADSPIVEIYVEVNNGILSKSADQISYLIE